LTGVLPRWRGWIGVLAGLAAVSVLLALPVPARTAGRKPGPAPSATGPTLASVWPAARPFTVPASLPDGSSYVPTLILDPTTSVGVSTSADTVHAGLVVVTGTGPPRVLQTHVVSDGGSFDGIAVNADRLFWMHTISDATGHAQVSLWSAARSGGPARKLTADVGEPLFYGSAYDVQIVAGRLYWTAARPGRPDQTELRSVALAGGRVTVRVLDGPWTMTAWPWLVTAPNAVDAPIQLDNLATGARTPVKVPASKQVSCSPIWCRTIPNNIAQGSETDLVRPDGTDARRIGDANATAVASDVALLDRFEVLVSTVSSNANTTVSRLSLYDIAHRRTVLIDPAATNAGARGAFLWWSTGDNETLTWHGLDLRTLP
jgi:hypothetical protein